MKLFKITRNGRSFWCIERDENSGVQLLNSNSLLDAFLTSPSASYITGQTITIDGGVLNGAI